MVLSTLWSSFAGEHSLSGGSARCRRALACTLCAVVAAVGVGADNTVAAAAFAADTAWEPVHFAAGALDAPPPGAETVVPGLWPRLVPDCTTAYLNATVAAAAAGSANTTVVVRIDVPAGRAVSLRGCRTPGGVNVSGSGDAAVAAGGLWHVRLVLAMGRSSAVALEAWDVAVGGVTIEGPAGNASNVVDALVVVRGGSRIVAGTGNATARAGSSDPADDVHALSAVAPVAQGTASVSGLGLVVMQGSVVRAQHDGTGALYASACGVRAEAAQDPTLAEAGPASLTVKGLRVVVTGGSSTEASATRSGAGYDYKNTRRAHAATIQALQGARVIADFVVVAVLDGSTASAFGDEGSSAGGGIGVNGRERGSASVFIPTAVALAHATLIAGPDSAVRVTATGRGAGASAMGVVAYSRGATASMSNSAVFAVGPNTTVAVQVTGGHGWGASAMGVAAYFNGATASATDAVFAVGPNTTVIVNVTGGAGWGVTAMGVAAVYTDAMASMTNATVYAAGPGTSVTVHIVGGGGRGASAMGVAARNHAKASMTNTTVSAVGPNTAIAVFVTEGNGGAGATAMGAAASFNAKVSLTNSTVYAAGPLTSVTVHVTEDGAGASAMGAAASFTGATASMPNTAIYAVGPNTTVAVEVVGGGSGFGASVMGVVAYDGGRFDSASGPSTIARCPDVAVTAEGAGDIVDFNNTPHPDVTFTSPLQCPPVPEMPSLPPLALPREKEIPDGGGGGVSRSGRFASRSAAVHHTGTTVAARGRESLSPLTVTITAPPLSLPQPGSDSNSATASASAMSTAPTTASLELASEAEAVVVVSVPESPVPAAASASASVLAGVLLPSSASKPTGNSRALQVADVCLSAVGEGEALEDAAPGEWPSDYAVIVARWRVGGGDDPEGSAARARAAGAAVAVACAAMAGAAAVARFAAPDVTGGRAATSPDRLEDGRVRRAATTTTAAAPSAPASALAVAFVVAAAYLVPNAIEAAVVAATAGLGETTGAAGAVAGAAMVAAVVPVFAAPVIVARATVAESLAGRVACFLHPVLVDGLRDEALPLLRAHALLDVAAACVIAAASGATQAGVRVGGSCVLLTLVMAAAAVGLTAYYAFLRPFAARLEVAVATAQAGTLAVLCGLTLTAVASGGSAVSGSVLGVAGLAAEAVTFGAPVVLAMPVAWAWLRGGGRGGGGRKDDSDDDAAAVAAASVVGGTSRVSGDDAAAEGDGGEANVPLLTFPERNREPSAAVLTRAATDGTATKGHVRRNPLASDR